MKKLIYTHYNIYIEELTKLNNDYYFYYNDELYKLSLVENDINIVEKIYKFYKQNNIDCYEIIPNKENKFIIENNKKKYALLKINGILKYEINYKEFKYYEINQEPLNWGELWSERLNYYNIQIRELGYNYQTVLNSYGFFEGIVENAILYYNLTLNKFQDKKNVAIVHNRMNYPCYQIDYNNPLNNVIDYNIRDIAEYIKSYIMSDEFNIMYIFDILNNLNCNNLMFNLLYCRLLYPTFYFDAFDKIILDNKEDKDIVPILNRVDRYIYALREIYNKYNQKYNLFNLEWLNKKIEI